MPAAGVAEVGQLERAFNQMAGSLERNRDELAELAAEQAALRRVATLVARGASPPQVFSAVAEEVAQRLGTEVAKVLRYEPDGTATVVGGWSVPGMDIPIGTRLTVEGQGVAVSILRTGRPARVERQEGPAGSVAACFASLGVHSGVGSPILVEGRLWGVAIAGSTHPDPPPAGSEDRILAFTELVATAIANAEARAGLRRIVEEQAALRRVATLVARGVAPDLVLAAVAEETQELLGADLTTIFRFEPDGTATLMGGHGWRQADMDLGTRWKPESPSVVASVLDTGRPARSDNYSPTSPSLPEVVRREGIRSGVASPILVEGRLWGAIVVSSRHGPLPPDTEQRMVDFTELVATAIANAESRAELAASRARVVAAADETRRRIERDLHDGAQQRLVSLALRLRTAAMAIPPDMREVHEELAGVGSELDEVLGDLRELSRGIHPAILSEGGVGPALRTLARRSSVPVQLQVGTPERLPERVEVAAYYVVSEALTNVAKHANASAVRVDVDADDGLVRLAIHDNGVGGADPSRGSGLIGLKDRVEATGGTLHVESRPGEGTSLVVELPIDAGQPRDAT
jgi:signal transduction histidine kinase